jgi:hypothetical protein
VLNESELMQSLMAVNMGLGKGAAPQGLMFGGPAPKVAGYGPVFDFGPPPDDLYYGGGGLGGAHSDVPLLPAIDR